MEIDKTVNVTIRGYRVYVETKYRELYDFHIPTTHHRLFKKDVQPFVNEDDEIIAIKRENHNYNVPIDTIIQNNLN